MLLQGYNFERPDLGMLWQANFLAAVRDKLVSPLH